MMTLKTKRKVPKTVDIKGYPNYTINTQGEIYSKRNKKKLKLSNINKGYQIVTLYNKGESKNFLVHRLMADHFLPIIEGKDQIDHIDGRKDNNKIENLEWVDVKENIRRRDIKNGHRT